MVDHVHAVLTEDKPWPGSIWNMCSMKILSQPINSRPISLLFHISFFIILEKFVQHPGSDGSISATGSVEPGFSTLLVAKNAGW